jgi:hypothetical protein
MVAAEKVDIGRQNKGVESRREITEAKVERWTLIGALKWAVDRSGNNFTRHLFMWTCPWSTTPPAQQRRKQLALTIQGIKPHQNRLIPTGYGENTTSNMEIITNSNKFKSALFNFQSLLLVILLFICTCTYVRAVAPRLIDVNKVGSVYLMTILGRVLIHPIVFQGYCSKLRG